LLHQNTPRLAELFKLSYESYAEGAHLDKQAFIAGIHAMVIDIIEPICQQNPDCPAIYADYLKQFNQYDQGDSIKHPHALVHIALAMTHLAQCAIESFRVLKYPAPYDRLIHLLESVFNNPTVIENNKHRDALILLEQLRQKP